MAVIKILSRHSPSFNNLINYILKPQKNEKPQVFTHNLHSKDPRKAAQEFLQNEVFRANVRKDQVFLYHEIISFSNLDKGNIQHEALQCLAQQYIALRGDKGIFFGAVHGDKDHTHIHFCTSGVELYTGKAMRLSKESLKKLKTDFQLYHLKKYPQIERSTCEHGTGKSYQKNTEYFKSKKKEMKTQIEKIVATCLDKADTQKQFLDLLRENNLHHYERREGEPSGIIYENTRFRFTSLDFDIGRFKSLPRDDKEEQRILKELEELRSRVPDRNFHRTLEFEENGVEKRISYNLETKSEYTRDTNGTVNEIESELTADEFLEYERMNAVMNEYPDRFDSEDPDLDTDGLEEPNDSSENTEVESSEIEMDYDDEPEMDSNEPDMDV